MGTWTKRSRLGHLQPEAVHGTAFLVLDGMMSSYIKGVSATRQKHTHTYEYSKLQCE